MEVSVSDGTITSILLCNFSIRTIEWIFNQASGSSWIALPDCYLDLRKTDHLSLMKLHWFVSWSSWFIQKRSAIGYNLIIQEESHEILVYLVSCLHNVGLIVNRSDIVIENDLNDYWFKNFIDLLKLHYFEKFFLFSLTIWKFTVLWKLGLPFQVLL